ncbi:MAG: AAA family ATPase [Nitrospirota bacterium]
MFITDLAADPFRQQFILGIYGRPGCGKTQAILDLAEARHFVYMVSTDRGLMKARLNTKKYQGRLLPIYIIPTPEEAIADVGKNIEAPYTRLLYRRLSTLCTEKIPALLMKGIPADRIWIVVDNATHLQQQLLREGQDEAITTGMEKAVQRAGTPKDKDRGKGLSSHVQQQLLTTPEWGANQAIMAGISEFLMKVPVNLVWTFHEKNDKDFKDKYRASPAVQGASWSKYVGDLDVLLHLGVNGDGTRTFRTRPTPSWDAKDRSRRLPEEIEFKLLEDGEKIPTLLQIRNLIFAGMDGGVATDKLNNKPGETGETAPAERG